MGRGGGQVFSGPGPVQTPPEIIEDITAEELDIRQLREDMRLNHVVIGGCIVLLAVEGGWRDRLAGERHTVGDRVIVRCFIERLGTSLPQPARATAFHTRLSESPPRSSVKEACQLTIGVHGCSGSD